MSTKAEKAAAKAQRADETAEDAADLKAEQKAEDKEASENAEQPADKNLVRAIEPKKEADVIGGKPKARNGMGLFIVHDPSKSGIGFKG